MDAALSRLLLLRMRGGVRHRIGQLASLRGVAFLSILAGLAWFLSHAGASSPGSSFGGPLLQDPDELRAHIANFMPLGLLGASLFTVFVSTGPALYFSQNEINFLFAGPFRRRDLIVYKFCAYFAGAVVSALIITLLIPPRTSTVAGAFTGTLLTLLFIQLSSAAIRMIALAFGSGWLVRVRWQVVIVLLAAVSATLFYLTATTDHTIFDVLSGLRQSWPGTILLAPFAVFAELFLADDIFPDLAAWAALAIVINAALLLVIIALDDRTSERSLSENARLNSRWLRVKQGGSFWASDSTTSRSMRRSPVAGGLGPVAWRQAINAVRNSGKVIAVFLIIAVLTGPLLASAGIEAKSSGSLGSLYFFVAFILPRTLVCDFRGELARMEHYKALPIAPWRICAGQLAMPVLLASAIQLLMILSIVPFVDITTAVILLALTVFTLPFNLVLYGLENLLFLFFPAKLVPVGRVDFDFLGRALVEFVLKTFIIFSAIAIARAAGLTVQRMTGELAFSFGLTSWLTFTAIGLLSIPAMAYAFRRFSVSQTIE